MTASFFRNQEKTHAAKADSGAWTPATPPKEGGFVSVLDVINAGADGKLTEDEVAAATRRLIEAKPVEAGGICDLCVERRARAERKAAVVRQLPEALRTASFADLKDVGNMAAVKTALTSASENRKGVYQYGGVGAGKSTSHAACYLNLAGQGEQVHWTSQTALLRVIGEDGSMIRSYVQRACGGVLFIEDIGAPVDKGWSLAGLSSLIEELHHQQSRARVWFTSNYSLGELRNALPTKWTGITPYDADRIVSRIYELCVVIHNKGENMRPGAG